MIYKVPCGNPSPANKSIKRPWLTWLSLLACLTACAGPVPISPAIDPPPASLAAPCSAGPAYGEGDGITLGELLQIVAQREAAAAECRARLDRLVRAWPLRPP